MSILERKRKALMMPTSRVCGQLHEAQLSEDGTLSLPAAYEGRVELKEATGNYLQEAGFSDQLGTITYYTFHFYVTGNTDTGRSIPGYYYIHMPDGLYYHFYTDGFDETKNMVPYSFHFDTQTKTFYGKTLVNMTPALYYAPNVTVSATPMDNYTDFSTSLSTMVETGVGVNGFAAYETLPQTYSIPLVSCQFKRDNGSVIPLRALPGASGSPALADTITYTDAQQHTYTQNINAITLTGTENIGLISMDNTIAKVFTIPLTESCAYSNSEVVPLCTHFRGKAVMYTTLSNHAISHLHHLNGQYLYVRVDGWATVDAFKAFLASEYEKNTPVTIWYPLAMAWKRPLYPLGDVTPLINGNSIEMSTLGHFTLPESMRYRIYFDGVAPQKLTYLYHGFHHSFAGLQHIVRQGLATKYFSVGDQIEVFYDDGFYQMDILGIDHDPPHDKNYTHSLTLQFHEAITYDSMFNYEHTDWSRSSLRTWLNGEFLTRLESNMSTIIGEVDKINPNDSSMNSVEKVFLLSVEEVCGIADPGSNSSGTPYMYYQLPIGPPKNLAHSIRAKLKRGVTTTRQWWLRTTKSSSVAYVSKNGSIYTINADQSICVCPAFCIV